MHNLSVVQALSLWTDLETALAGTNSYGGNEAEIYMYRLSERNPSLEMFLKQSAVGELKGTITEETALQEIDKHNTSLYNILTHFAKTREASIMVEGRRLGQWLKKDRNTHRVHVKITKRRRRR